MLNVGFVDNVNSCLAFTSTAQHLSGCNALCWTKCKTSKKRGNVRVLVDGEYLKDLWEDTSEFVYCPDEFRTAVTTSVACGVVIVCLLGLGLAWELCRYRRQVRVLSKFRIE